MGSGMNGANLRRVWDGFYGRVFSFDGVVSSAVDSFSGVVFSPEVLRAELISYEIPKLTSSQFC